VTATPPTTLMKSRRLIAAPESLGGQTSILEGG
jgi:hypothetical protein